MPKRKKTVSAPTITPLAEIEVATKPRPFVLLAAPSAGGDISVGTVTAIQTATLGKCNVEVMFPATSMLTRTFNMAWLQFLQNHQSASNPTGYTHFAMIHNDIAANPGWLDSLLEDLDRHSLDLLSTLMPIKNDWGITSTAVSLQPTPHLPTMPLWPRRRITMAEANRLPPVFTFADVKALWEKDGIAPFPTDADCLLPNTGLWACKYGSWCDHITFHSENHNFQLPDGTWCHDENTEDWALGRDIAALNLRPGYWEMRGLTPPPPVRIAISRKPQAFHIGGGGVSNQGVWGKYAYDSPVCDPYNQSVAKESSNVPA